MSLTFRRVLGLTTMLCFAAGASALAAITVSPSNSITLQTRTKGMSGDPDAQRVEIAVTSPQAVKLDSNTCREKGLTDTVSGSVKTGFSESSGNGQPTEKLHYFNIALASRSGEGTCVLTFSDGAHTATVNVRIVKP